MGEDIELSIRIIQQGYKVGLIEEAFVYHKRRASFWQFFKQLRFFGRARINVSRFYPDEIKLIHWFPALFLIAESIWLFVTPLISIDLFYLGGIFNILFSVFVFTEAAIKTSNLYVGLLSIFTSYIQLLAYGTGLITEGFKKMLKG
jgi:cellulose synthase/poly-beta-1,6-N-acetylglucosamine synthase-like glycosyltransferase